MSKNVESAFSTVPLSWVWIAYESVLLSLKMPLKWIRQNSTKFAEPCSQKKHNFRLDKTEIV